MGYRWPENTEFEQVVLTVEQEVCSLCGHNLHICDHRFHHIFSLRGPLELVCKLAHCPDPGCAAHQHTLRPLAESVITLPWWTIGWDVFTWLGFRRFARHWSIPQLQAELRDTYLIRLSDDAIAGYLQRYRYMVAARHQDAALLADAYKDIDSLILTIDGLQPEKGHETLYVVRELRSQRVWFAEALLSSSAAEVQRLLAKAKDWATQLNKPVELWMSDKQDAFVTGIALEFPKVPHRYCQNHFLRDLAKPMLEKDSHTKVQMRKKVRGSSNIERQVIEDRRAAADAGSGNALVPREPAVSEPVAIVAPASKPAVNEPVLGMATVGEPGAETMPASQPSAGGALAGDEQTPAAALAVAQKPAVEPATDEVGDVVLDYCAAVRGILNDDQGGPLHPTGLRMAEALKEVKESIGRNLDAKRGGRGEAQLNKLANCIDRGLQEVVEEQEQIKEYVKEVKRVEATLDPSKGSRMKRKKRFQRLRRRLSRSKDAVRKQMAAVMMTFMVGLFAGPEAAQEIKDNLDLERWFRLPKGHERRIHGRRHAGVRLVQQGATLMPTLDAHKGREKPYTAEELLGYKDAKPPNEELEAIHRRKVMRRARSKKRRPALLAELERRYLAAP